jgi:hypothetical protein
MTEKTLSTPKYPAAIVRVDVTGPDGHAFAILRKAFAALQAAGAPQADLDAYRKEATAGDYENLLEVTSRWVDFTADVATKPEDEGDAR